MGNRRLLRQECGADTVSTFVSCQSRDGCEWKAVPGHLHGSLILPDLAVCYLGQGVGEGRRVFCLLWYMSFGNGP